MGDEVSARTRQAILDSLKKEIAARLDDSIEAEKEKNDFLSGVPAIVQALRDGKIEQHGAKRAGYGEELIRDLAQRLTKEFGRGYSKGNLFWFRRFYGDYPEFLRGTIFDASRQISKPPTIVDALRQISDGSQISGTTLKPAAKGYAVSSQSWQPGQLHLNLAWTHYRTLLRVEKSEARSFYEIEAVKNNWAARP